MQVLKIILTEDGQLDSVLSSDEVNLEVLTRGLQDNEIDEAEGSLELVDI